ncbi:MAG: hypothetical protein NTY55_01290 [Flavobacteriia bacterium]|jgi:hypothetical protein|nr:hypothetical protein [Flavobacteriia bacterium]
MDTLKVTIKKDTIVKTDTRTNLHTTIEKTNYNKCNDCLIYNFCDCKLLINLFWPLTIIIIIFYFRLTINNLLESISERIKKGDNIKLGTSGIEIQRPMKEEEVREKAEAEYKDTVEDYSLNVTKQKGTIVFNKEKFVQSYINIEKTISEKLRQYFSDKFRVMVNYRIQHFEYDIILNSPLTQDEDKIIEIKYFPRGTTTVLLRETLLRLYIAEKMYQDTLKKIARPILLIVIPKDKYNLFEIAKLKETLKHLKNIKLDNLSMHFLKEEELNDLTIEELRVIIEDN